MKLFYLGFCVRLNGVSTECVTCAKLPVACTCTGCETIAFNWFPAVISNAITHGIQLETQNGFSIMFLL